MRIEALRSSFVNGGSHAWRFDYTSRSAAKTARAEVAKKREAVTRIEGGLPPAGSFEAVAREWYEKNAPDWAATHSEKIIRRLERDVFPWIAPVKALRASTSL